MGTTPPTNLEQEKFNKLLREANKLGEEMNDTLNAGSAALAARAEAGKRLVEIEQEIRDGVTERVSIEQQAADAAKDALQTGKERLKSLAEERDELLWQVDNRQNLSDTQKKTLEERIIGLNQLHQLQGMVLHELREQSKEQRKALAFQKDMENVGGGLMQQTLGISDAWKSTKAGIFAASVKTHGFGTALAGVGKGMSKSLSSANILGSTMGRVVQATITMALKTDEAMASFNKATAAGGQYNDVLIEASIDARQFGVSMTEAVGAATELYSSMTGFTELTKASQVEVIALTSGMAKLGVSASDTGQLLDTAMKGFGMTAGEATDMSKELFATATALRVPAGKMAKDFNASMKELAKYGPKGIKVFKGLAATAKVAGVEMGELLGIAGQFDTIEGAAEATGKLNAILGGNMLNSMQLLNATEEERITLLQESVAASGKSWSSMDRFEKQAIAGAAGISDMNTANKLFGQGLGAFDDAAAKVEDLTAAQADMAVATDAATSIGENLTLMTERMAVFVKPLIYLLRLFFDIVFFLTDGFASLGKTIQNLGKHFGPIGFLFEWIGMLITELAGPLGLLVFLFAVKFVAALFGVTLGFSSLGLSISFAFLPPMLSAIAVALGFAAAILLILLPFALLGYAIYKLVKHWDQIWDAMVKVWDIFTGFFTEAGSWMDWLLGIGVYFAPFIAIPLLIVRYWDQIIDTIVGVWDTFTGFFTEAGSWMDWLLGFGALFAPFIAIPLLIVRHWGAIKEFFVDLWDGIVNLFTSPVDTITRTWARIGDFFGGLWDGIVEGLARAKNFIIKIFDSLGTFLSAALFVVFSPINLLIMGLNKVIGLINTISITVPDWVPGIGGEGFGFSIPMIPTIGSLPAFEEGGFIEEGGAAILHPGEEVVPAKEAKAATDKKGLFDTMMSANPILGLAANFIGGVVGGGEDELAPLIEAIKANTAAVSKLAAAGTGAAGGAGKTIVLEIDGTQFARAVTDSLNSTNMLQLG